MKTGSQLNFDLCLNLYIKSNAGLTLVTVDS